MKEEAWDRVLTLVDGRHLRIARAKKERPISSVFHKKRNLNKTNDIQTKTPNKNNSSKEEVGGLGHHVREYGMTPRRYILGSWPFLNIKLTSHKE